MRLDLDFTETRPATYELPHLEDDLEMAWHAVIASGVDGVENLSREAFLDGLRRSRLAAMRALR